MTADRLTHLEGVVEGLAEDVAELRGRVDRLRRPQPDRRPPDCDPAAPCTLDEAIAFLRNAHRALLGKQSTAARRVTYRRIIALLEMLRKGGTP